jgi:hypothetical protein
MWRVLAREDVRRIVRSQQERPAGFDASEELKVKGGFSRLSFSVPIFLSICRPPAQFSTHYFSD